MNRGEGVSQVVAEHGDELLAQFGGRLVVDERRLARRQPILGVEVEADQVGEEPKHADRRRIVEFGWARVDGAERAEKAAVAKSDRHGNVASEAVSGWRRMTAVDVMFRHVVDDHGLAIVADFAADRARDIELVAGLEAEIDLVEKRAGDPSVLRDPGDGREPHAGRLADDLEHGGDSPDPRYCGDIVWNVTHGLA